MRTSISGPVLTLLALGLTARAPGPAAGDRTGPLPDSFGWSSTGPLIGPEQDAGHPKLPCRPALSTRTNSSC
ncbi:hypothetical protein [Streptomyces canus]|uniref:hypothetical protein n=1 Tax=Streptomyces canus TaxID=58343 RepID=UPI00372357A9